MKLNKILGGLAFTAILGSGFASCSNEMDGLDLKNNDMLLRAPKAIAYAGNQKDNPFSLGFGTRGTRSGEEISFGECKTSVIDREKEAAFIEEKLPEKNGNIDDSMYTNGLFYAAEETNIEMYPVFSQTTTPNSLGVFYWDTEGNYHEVIVWDNMDPWSLTETDHNEPVLDSWVEDPDWWNGEGGYYAQYGVTYSKGVSITIPEGCTFGFYWKGHTNSEETVYYSDPSMNMKKASPVYRTDGGGTIIEPKEECYIHAVSFEHDGKTYLGLEDWTDFDYQDWVFTIDTVLTPASEKPETPGTTTPEPETPTNPDPETPTNPDPETPEVPGIQIPDNVDPGFTVTPDVPVVKGEVEVNLALDEKKDDNVRSSHLSIHIRKATDVEIFIPVPAQYYCEADDMAIVMKHEQNHMAHGGPKEFTWTLKDSDPALTVSLFVQYEDDGIRIWTKGVTQEVIDWCYEKCQDGITFEVWNYFNDPETGNPLISIEELRKYLDQATIKFTVVPDYYVNSFADPNGKYDAEGNPNGDDFHVRPENPNDFNYQYEGEHQNGSAFNDIYTNVVKDEPPMPTPPPVPVY